MTLMHRRGLFMLGAAAALAVPARPRAQSLTTIADTLAGDTRFSRFLDLVTRASMVDAFRQSAPMTVFAPVDQAFAGAPAGALQDLLGQQSQGGGRDQERQRVMALINYHIVRGAFAPGELTGADRRLRTANGGDLQIANTGGAMTVRNPAPGQQLGSFGAAGFQVSPTPAQVVGSPIQASNGIIYPINQILWP